MKKEKKAWLVFGIFLIIVVILRLLLVMRFPIFAYIDYVDDDELMVQQAKSIASGEWLGEYSYNTLLKSPVFPLYLAALFKLKLPYLLTTTMIYIVASCIFVISLKDVIKNKIVLGLLLVIIMFNPIMMSVDFQRPYRYSLASILALYIISFYNFMLFKANDKKVIFFIIPGFLASLVFPFFYYVREDSMWIVPFMIFYSIIILVKIFKEYLDKENRKKWYFLAIKCFIIVLPIITLSIFRLVIGNVNYKYYNTKIINSNEFENLNRAIKMIGLVKDNNKEKEVTNSREKLKELYEISPSLKLIEEKFEMSLDNLSNEKDGEVKNGMFSWTLLTGSYESGFNTFEKQNELFGNIADEIEEAIKLNKCETQDMIPIFKDVSKNEFKFDKFIKYVAKSIKVINDYHSFGQMDTYGSLYSDEEHLEERARLFLEYTNDKLILNNEEAVWRNNLGELMKENQKDYLSSMELKIAIIKTIQNIYAFTFKILPIIGYISYCVITIAMIVFARKKNYDFVNDWFILSGIVGSVFTLCVGIAYTSAAKVVATISFYLMSGYVLNSIFIALSIISLIKVINYAKNRSKDF